MSCDEARQALACILVGLPLGLRQICTEAHDCMFWGLVTLCADRNHLHVKPRRGERADRPRFRKHDRPRDARGSEPASDRRRAGCELHQYAIVDGDNLGRVGGINAPRKCRASPKAWASRTSSLVAEVGEAADP